jgi:hypothetical protein
MPANSAFFVNSTRYSIFSRVQALKDESLRLRILHDRIRVLEETLSQDKAAEIKAAHDLQCGIAVLRNQNKVCMAVSSLFTYRRIESMSQNLQDRLGDSQVTDVRHLQSQADISLDKDRIEASGSQVAILKDRIHVLEETCAAKEGAKEGADKASQEFRCEIAVLQTQNKASRGKFGTHLVTNQKFSQTLQARLQSEKELQVINSIALQIGPKNCCIRMVSTS